MLTQQPELASVFLKMRDDLLFLMRAIYDGVKDEAKLIGIDGTQLFAAVSDDIEKKIRRLHIAESAQDESE
jgi:hypothetical protein